MILWEEKFLYKVERFEPPEEIGRLGGFGFSVKLDRDFAKKAFALLSIWLKWVDTTQAVLS